MYYFNSNMHDKKLPKKGDVIWLMPIRYWEPDEYGPEKFTVEKATTTLPQTRNGRLSLYGQFEKEKPNTPMYAAKDMDSQWFWSEENCRKAQLLFKQIYDVVLHDETNHIVEKILKEENKK